VTSQRWPQRRPLRRLQVLLHPAVGQQLGGGRALRGVALQRRAHKVGPRAEQLVPLKGHGGKVGLQNTHEGRTQG
jgi:hypothetical protein